jgi:adenylate kinase family enzyme
LLPHFLLLVVGKPGSGKSYLTKELFTQEKMYKGKFDYTVVISPSIQKLGIPVKKDFKNTQYDLGWIHHIIGKINE